MIDLTFDNGTVERFTLVLSQRDYTHLGQITNVEGMKFKANLNAADELSFEVHKELDGIEEMLWDDIYDLRLVWIPELDEYFEIDVESTDTVNVTKTVTAKSLCESELSQTYLHDIEINTADDIARPDYDANYPTVFYRDGGSEAENKASLLHRILEKVPAYTIGHVDDTLKSQQRIFSISDTSLYDFMVGECSEQFNCLFQFDSATRTISAYDLQSTCMNDDCSYYVNKHLRYRGLFNDFCPICGSSNITSFGEDTNVFVSTENLTDEVKFDTDVNSMKNCFRLEAGDDNMTAAVINSNPNGTRYIYEFNAETKKDMPAELVTLINNYDTLYETYNESADMGVLNNVYCEVTYLGGNPKTKGWYEYNVTTHAYTKTNDTSVVSGKHYYNKVINAFNEICAKYNVDSTYHKGSNNWKTIPMSGETTQVNGYKNLIPHYYNCIDFYQYLKSSMMPPVVIPQSTVSGEMTNLTNGFNSEGNTIGMSVTPTAVASIESAVVNLAKLYVNSGYVRVTIDKTNSWSATAWNGIIKLTNFEDDSDSVTKTFALSITTNFDTFMDQKISKYIKRAKESVDYYNVLKMPYGTTTEKQNFANELKKYSAARLQSIRDSLSAVIGILVEAGQGIKEPADKKAPLYDSFYVPYYQKLQAAETELNTRNLEIEIVNGIQDANGNATKKGTLQSIIDSILKVQKALNFKEYIYDHTSPKSYDLYNVYTTYIREETYSNSNYISDDLNNDQLFENAGRFLDMAKTELHKSATYQHSITSNLNNLIAIPAFKPLLNKFNLGNWIRVQEDERVYRLRLISYSIDFDNIAKLDTEFSDVTMTADGLNDVMSIIKQASSMATSYSYTQQQASDGADVKYNYIDRWVENGLNSALVKINNNTDEDISIDNTGILARTYDDIEDEHGPKQLRITHNVIAFTDDNWQSVKTGVGEFDLEHHIINSNGVNTSLNTITESKYGIVSEAVLSGWIIGSNMETSTIIGSHFQAPGNNSYIDMTTITTANSGREYFIKCHNGTEDKFSVKKDGTVIAKGTITAEAGSKIGPWDVSASAITYNSATYGNGLYWGTSGLSLGTKFKVSNAGVLECSGATVSGTLTAGANSIIGPWNISASSIWYGSNTYGGSNSLYFGTSGLSVKDKFKVSSAGVLTCSGATVSGTLTAGAGSVIGPWNVSTAAIYTGSYATAGKMYFGTSGLSVSNKFYVDSNGNLTCTGGASIKGTITADGGQIGNWYIDTNTGSPTSKKGYLYSTENSYSSYIARGFIHLLSSDGGSWHQFLANTINNYCAVKNSPFYVSNGDVNGSAQLDNTSDPYSESRWIRIKYDEIERKNGNERFIYPYVKQDHDPVTDVVPIPGSGIVLKFYNGILVEID